MSSDTFIGVFSSKDFLVRDSRWYAAEGMMANIENPEDEQKWKESIIKSNPLFYPTRIAALEAAHNKIAEVVENYNCPIVEYGVIELE